MTVPGSPRVGRAPSVGVAPNVGGAPSVGVAPSGASPELSRPVDGALTHLDWVGEYERLSAADRAGWLPAADIEQWAVAAFMLGRDDEVVQLRDRAHRGYLADGRPDLAARCVFWLGFHLSNRGEWARAGGWLERLRRLVDGLDPAGPFPALVLLADAFLAMTSGDLDAGLQLFQRAGEVGERCAEPDLCVLANLGRGQCLILKGELRSGVAALDAAMVTVTVGEAGPQVIGMAYCTVIGSSLGRFDLGRANEWTTALSGWCDAQDGMVPYRGVCLVNRAEIFKLRGAWPQAQQVAQQACAELLRSGEAAIGRANYQLGELHRLRGENDAAEGCFAQAARYGQETQPGLALLRLAQQRIPAAVSGLRRALGEHTPPTSRAGLLGALVEICLAAADLPSAAAACDELTASEPTTPFLRAMAGHARGALLLAQGDPQAALVILRAALRLWQESRTPYEEARTRLLVAAACRELGDQDAARMEVDAALVVFHRLGAVPDRLAAENLRAVSSQAGAERDGLLSPRELEVLRLVATGRTNRGIAHELSISEKTVARHVSNLFAKLDLANRAAATAYAYQHHLC